MNLETRRAPRHGHYSSENLQILHAPERGGGLAGKAMATPEAPGRGRVFSGLRTVMKTPPSAGLWAAWGQAGLPGDGVLETEFWELAYTQALVWRRISKGSGLHLDAGGCFSLQLPKKIKWQARQCGSVVER